MSYQAGAQLDMAKAGTEGVKQGNLQSDTDLKNLNFIEQESGVTQERAKELHGEQARSQMQLKLMEHDLNKETVQQDLVKEYLKQRMKQPTAKK
jgi:rare lipoprotein A (peptidoglycan hydrolase)